MEVQGYTAEITQNKTRFGYVVNKHSLDRETGETEVVALPSSNRLFESREDAQQAMAAAMDNVWEE